MRVPPENWLAAFPVSEKAGRVELGPLTLEGAILLGREGIDCGGPVPREKVLSAAAILAKKLPKRPGCSLEELCNAVERILNAAFATYVKPPESKGATQSVTPRGFGWPLELAEFLCGEYGWSFADALATPVATAYALLAASRQRHCEPCGIDYMELQYNRDVKAGKAKPIRL